MVTGAGCSVRAMTPSATIAIANPIVAGDRPDPSIIKDGRDCHMAFSMLEACPGLIT